MKVDAPGKGLVDHLVVPYTLDTNDMRFASPGGFPSGEQFFAHLRDAFDVLYAEGTAGAPKMLSVGLHCRIVGRPARTAALERFLDHVQSHDDVWVARRIEIARHWRAVHPRLRTDRCPREDRPCWSRTWPTGIPAARRP